MSVPGHRRCSPVLGAWVVALSTSVAGCELAETVAPALESRAVVHAVLNPAATQQLVIVEKTLRSASGAGAPTRDPITGARVVVYGSREDSSVAVADAATLGVYRIPSVTITNGTAGTAPPNVLRLRPGERYRLRVETPLGVVTGETTVPIGVPVAATRRTFNVDRDTLRLDVSTVRNAAGYLLRHEARMNVAERYRTTLDAALFLPLAIVQGDPNEQEWSFAFARALVLPGLPQNFIVVAVDSNYFRYHVAGFDPFGDDTRGNSLQGGVGMFGSVATLMNATLDLTAEIDSPIEGAWAADRTSLTLPATMTLYSSPYFPGSGSSSFVPVSGRARSPAGRPLEVYGSVTGNGVSMEVIDPTAAGVASGATGQLTGGALVLTDTRTGERVTYRKP